MNEINRHFGERQALLHLKDRDTVFFRELCFRIGIETLSEFGDLVCLDRKAGCHFVSAILEQEVFLRRQCFIDIESGNGAARALPDPVSDRQHQYRTMVDFQDA